MGAGIRSTNLRTYSLKGGTVYLAAVTAMMAPARRSETRAKPGAFRSQAVAGTVSQKFL